MKLSIYVHILISIFSVFSGAAMAAPSTGFTTTRMGFIQRSYTGEKGLSFAESKSGYGLSATVLLDNSIFVPFVSAQISTLSGKQVFLDGAQDRSLAFDFYQSDFELGAQLFLIPRRKSNISIYLRGAGVAGLSYLSLDSSQPIGGIASSDKSFGVGYTFGCGAEVLSHGPNKWSIYSDLQLIFFQTALLNQNFDLGGLVFSVGVGW